MAYQYKGSTRGPGGPPPKPKHNWINKTTRESRQREKMMDKSRESYFKYDMEEILKRGKVPEEQWASLTATIFAKGTRVSTEAAKEFVKEKQTEGIIDEPTANTILRAIEDYSRWR